MWGGQVSETLGSPGSESGLKLIHSWSLSLPAVDSFNVPFSKMTHQQTP